MGVYQIRGTRSRGPYKDYISILGSILWSPDFRKMSYNTGVSCFAYLVVTKGGLKNGVICVISAGGVLGRKLGS